MYDAIHRWIVLVLSTCMPWYNYVAPKFYISIAWRIEFFAQRIFSSEKVSIRMDLRLSHHVSMFNISCISFVVHEITWRSRLIVLVISKQCPRLRPHARTADTRRWVQIKTSWCLSPLPDESEIDKSIFGSSDARRLQRNPESPASVSTSDRQRSEVPTSLKSFDGDTTWFGYSNVIIWRSSAADVQVGSGRCKLV